MNGEIAKRAVIYLRRHHIGLLALFVALSGTAYAATKTAPKNSVASKSIRKKAVTKPKVAPNAINGSKVADGSLTGADIAVATLGTVPSASRAASATTAESAAAATKAESATTAQNAAKADDADRLGGAAPGSYVKGSDAIAAGALAGTYTAPTLRGSAVGTAAGTTGVFAPDTCDASSSVSGPSVTITVPASGLVEFLVRTRFQTVGGNSLNACLAVDGGSPIPLLSSTSLTGDTRYSLPGSTTGTNDESLAAWRPIFTSPGNHTFELNIGRTGVNPGTNQVNNRLLLVRALS